MRIVFLAITFSFLFNAIGQIGKLNQVKAIYDEGNACFQKYLGNLLAGTDTLSASYSSSITIEGTFNNEILKNKEGCMYSAQISDFVPKKEAQDIAEDWISDLKKSFRPFEKEKKKNVFGQIDVIAYQFREGKYLISIDVSSQTNNPAKAIVMIYISYYP